MRNFLTFSSKKLEESERQLYVAEDNNEKHEKYYQDYVTNYGKLNEVAAKMTDTKNKLKIIETYKEDYRNSRIEFLEDKINAKLLYLFPEEKFQVKFRFENIAGKPTAELLVGKLGYFAPARAQNGRFVKQLISSTSVIAINELRGSHMIFLDEAMASAADKILTELNPLFAELHDRGLEILLVEHKPGLYNTVTRREIHLRKDHEADHVIIEGIFDIQGELKDGEVEDGDTIGEANNSDAELLSY